MVWPAFGREALIWLGRGEWRGGAVQFGEQVAVLVDAVEDVVGGEHQVHRAPAILLPERIRQLAYLQFLQVRADAPEMIDAVVGRLLEVL